MSFHTDYESWVRMSDPRHCPICNSEPMPVDMADIVELPYSWLNAQPVDCLKGACHLVAKKHAVELFDLSEEDLLGLMREVQISARAIKAVTGAVKMNYEIHGNSIPHLHIHLYPRYLNDPFPGRAIDYNRKANQYAEGEFEVFVEAVRSAITSGCASKGTAEA